MKLHEKKISELIKDGFLTVDWKHHKECDCNYDGWDERCVIEGFKQWAIAVVKELRRVEKKDYGWYCPRCEVGFQNPKHNYCWDCILIANFLIERFELTEEVEEDLK